MLFFHIKHSRPDIVNAISDLSKANGGANPAAFKQLLCVMKYILVTKNLCLKLEPTRNAREPWEIACFSDSGYMGHPVSRIKYKYIHVYVLGVLVS